MFFVSRTLFAILLLFLSCAFVFLHFRGALSEVVTSTRHYLKVANHQVSAAAEDDKYNVIIKKNTALADIPALPDISRYTVDNVALGVPPFKPGKVVIADMTGLPAFREFINNDGRVQRLRLSQLTVIPRAIVIQEGHYDFTRLYEAIQAQTTENIIEKKGARHLVRLPILISKNASLTISNRDSDEILLSQEQNAFIVNAGDLFILRAKVTGWSEKDAQPAFFKSKLTYRPFITSWSGARLYIAGSAISNMGYNGPKSYGVSFSRCPRCLLAQPNLARPTGAVIGNVFSDMYFGFYSYEADDVAIIGNTYVNSIVYAIDPHDRSRRLIIAGNDTYGSKQKHGIILSREVSDSWIFNNHSHHNNGSGIMLDRKSENNVIANNISAYNRGDGLTFFESPHNTVYGNKIYRNMLSGIRIRNSWSVRLLNDEIADNAGVPVVIYTADLRYQPYEYRDLMSDPFTIRADVTVSGAVIKRLTGKPAFKIDGIDSLALSDIHLLSGGSVFSDLLFLDEAGIRKNIDTPLKQIVVSKKAS